MRVVQILQNLEIQIGEKTEEKLEKDNFYIMSDDLYSKLKILAGHALGMEINFRDIYNPYQGQDLNGRKVLALRHGGFGDILFLTTGYAELKRKYPKCSLNIAISPIYFPIIKNNPDIDQVISLPISLDKWNEFNYHFIFENLIENNPLAQEYNAYDLFMQQMKLDIKTVPPENKIPKLYLEDSEISKAKSDFPWLTSENKKVGIQVASSSPIRNYPSHKYLPIIEYLISKKYDVYLFGSSNQMISINYLQKQFKDDKVYSVVEDLRNAIIIASFMNYIIAPDSMMTHLAAALDIPVIGIYGPFHSSLRMKYFKNAIGIDAQTACSPCFTHGFFPCSKGDPSPCLLIITPKIIISAFKEIEKINQEVQQQKVV